MKFNIIVYRGSLGATTTWEIFAEGEADSSKNPHTKDYESCQDADIDDHTQWFIVVFRCGIGDGPCIVGI